MVHPRKSSAKVLPKVNLNLEVRLAKSIFQNLDPISLNSGVHISQIFQVFWSHCLSKSCYTNASKALQSTCRLYCCNFVPFGLLEVIFKGGLPQLKWVKNEYLTQKILPIRNGTFSLHFPTQKVPKEPGKEFITHEFFDPNFRFERVPNFVFFRAIFVDRLWEMLFITESLVNQAWLAWNWASKIEKNRARSGAKITMMPWVRCPEASTQLVDHRRVYQKTELRPLFVAPSFWTSLLLLLCLAACPRTTAQVVEHGKSDGTPGLHCRDSQDATTLLSRFSVERSLSARAKF